jgi:hypothetical protein
MSSLIGGGEAEPPFLSNNMTELGNRVIVRDDTYFATSNGTKIILELLEDADPNVKPNYLYAWRSNADIAKGKARPNEKTSSSKTSAASDKKGKQRTGSIDPKNNKGEKGGKGEKGSSTSTKKG